MPEREPQSVRDFLPEIPEGIVVITGNEKIITDTTDIFFDDVLNYLGVTQNARRVFVKREITYASIDPNGYTMLDGGDDTLIVQDLPVARVSHRRDDYNFVQGLFSLHLTPEWEQKVRERLIPPDGPIIHLDSSYHDFH